MNARDIDITIAGNTLNISGRKDEKEECEGEAERGHGEGDAGAVEDAGEDVAAQLVGPEEKSRGGALEA